MRLSILGPLDKEQIVARIVVNENSTLFLTFTFTDEVGDPVVPTSIDWRVDNIDDPHNPVQILDWAVVGVPAASVGIQVPAAQNGITDQTNVLEKRVVTVRMNDGLSSEAHDSKNYLIKNLKAAP